MSNKTNLIFCVVGIMALAGAAAMDDDTRNNAVIKANAPELMKAEPGEYSRLVLRSESESKTGGVVCYVTYKLHDKYGVQRCFELASGELIEVLR